MGVRKTRAKSGSRHHEQLVWSIRGGHSLFEAEAMSDLSVRQERIYDYIFSEFTEQGMQALLTKVFALKNRMEKASAISSTGLDD